MVLRSMTGFGRGDAEQNGRRFDVEIRCVNNRHLDLKLKLPAGMQVLEERIRRAVMSMHNRGRVDLQLKIRGGANSARRVHLNEELAESYCEAIIRLSRRLGLEPALTAEQVASFPEVITREEEQEDVEALWPPVEKSVRMALEGCETMRLQEGAALSADLGGRLAAFADGVSEIERRLPELVVRRQRVLKERLDKLLGDVSIDQERLAQEVAILADKSDVTEEIVRLHSHIEQFSSFLSEEGAVGRKLDFLVQEFLREVNTIASKINDTEVARVTVELKSELEKIREQIQNIE